MTLDEEIASINASEQLKQISHVRSQRIFDSILEREQIRRADHQRYAPFLFELEQKIMLYGSFKKSKLLFREKEIDIEEVGESKHRVLKCTAPFSNRPIIIKVVPISELYNLELERDLANSKLERSNGQRACRPINIFHTSENGFYFIVFEEGQLLADKIETKTASILDFQRVFKYLSQLHRNYSSEAIFGSERNFRKTLSQRLNSGLSSELANGFIANLEPLERSLDLCPLAIRIDAHPWNWIITEEEVIRLDTENTRPEPFVIDWANLLDHILYLGVDQKLDIIASEDFHPNLILSYFNAVCIRSLELFQPLSERATRKRFRNDWLENSITALDQIARMYPFYFRRFQREYQSLTLAFQRLKIAVNSDSTSIEISNT